jgi:hypothetical protein
MDRDIPLAVLSAETFFKLLKELDERRKSN